MSDKKEWREFWVFKDNGKPDGLKSAAQLGVVYDDLYVIEKAAYEAEKQRADSIAYAFKKYRREMSEDYQKTWERADRLEYALRAIALGAPDYYKDNKVEHAYLMELARKALNEQN